MTFVATLIFFLSFIFLFKVYNRWENGPTFTEIVIYEVLFLKKNNDLFSRIDQTSH